MSSASKQHGKKRGSELLYAYGITAYLLVRAVLRTKEYETGSVHYSFRPKDGPDQQIRSNAVGIEKFTSSLSCLPLRNISHELASPAEWNTILGDKRKPLKKKKEADKTVSLTPVPPAAPPKK